MKEFGIEGDLSLKILNRGFKPLGFWQIFP